MFWFIKSSVKLDFGLLFSRGWNFKKKFEFLVKKYFELFLLLTRIRKFNFGENKLTLFGKDVYYDSPYGIAGYQSMLVRQKKLLELGDVNNVKLALDIGANVGFYSMMLKEKFPKCKIHAFEPVPQIYGNLKRNLKLPKVKTYNIAISNKPGILKMSFDESFSAISQVIENPKSNDVVVKVKAQTLDNFVKENKIKKIDLLKIDTETYEANVLKGAKKALEITRFLVIEIAIKDNEKYTFSELNSLLFSKKYNFQLVSYRNFDNISIGQIDVGDFLYENILYGK